jgi:hypothetical protein
MKQTIAYCDYNSVLVVNSAGKLKQVFTPFRVHVIDDSGRLGQKFIVDEVRTTKEDQLIYIINEKAYYHHNFILAINF